MHSVPHSEEFERAVIAGVLVDPNILTRITDKLSSRDFYKRNHQEIFAVIESISPDNLDSLSVEEKLVNEEVKTYFKSLVAESDQILPSLSNIIYYAETIRDKSKLRAGINLGQEISAQCFQPNAEADEVLANLEQLFAKFIQDRIVNNKVETTQESFDAFVAELGKLKDDNGIKTGFYDVDLMLHKLEGLVIVAARPGVGKSAIALNIARNVAQTKPVIFFSLEMTREQCFERLLAAESEINLEEIKTQAFLSDKMGQAILVGARQSLQNALSRLYIDDTANVPTSYITSVARQKFMETGELGLIVVDYLHIMQLSNKPLVDALGDAVKELRALGKELGCPVLLLSQLSRQPEKHQGSRNNEKPNRRPELSDLRSSGEIEQTADVVIFLYRDSYYSMSGLAPDEDIAEIIIKKNRQGRTGIIQLEWIPRWTKFKDKR